MTHRLALAFTLALFAGCSDGNDGNDTDTDSTGDADTDADADADADADTDSDTDTDTDTDTDNPCDDGTFGPYDPTWTGVQAFFGDHCDKCHPGGPYPENPNLHEVIPADIASGVGYYVIPFDAANSPLWQRLNGYVPFGFGGMPWDRTTPLPECEREHVEQWILAGAPL